MVAEETEEKVSCEEEADEFGLIDRVTRGGAKVESQDSWFGDLWAVEYRRCTNTAFTVGADGSLVTSVETVYDIFIYLHSSHPFR